MKTAVRFDDSLPTFVRVVVARLGVDAFDRGRAVRDAYGRLTFLSKTEIESRTKEQLRKDLASELGSYASVATAVMDPSDIGASLLMEAPTNWRGVEINGTMLWVDLVDRRIIGQDWIVSPEDREQVAPPRLVFASMKGGVGRSTALCVLASHLAQQARNVLVIDADLEAPGLGTLLLGTAERPQYGLLDYLVEANLDGWDAGDIRSMVAPSLLTDRVAGQGIVEVVPTVGERTLANPVEMLAKLARGVLERPTDEGPKTFRHQLQYLVEEITSQRSYDAILIDARAGLSEIAAGALLGLSADVLFFGVNHSQTFEGLRFLLAHLAHLSRPENAERDWRRRLHFVHSKADPARDDTQNFQDRLYEVLSQEFYEAEEIEGAAFNFSVEDPEAPHVPLVINFDFPYMQFDPVSNPGQLRRETYRAGFQEFLTGASAILRLDERGRDRPDK